MNKVLFFLLFFAGMFGRIHSQSMDRLELINASTDKAIAGFTGFGDTIDVDVYPMINFRAVTSPDPMVTGTPCSFLLTTPSGATYSRSETGAPYALFGDISGDYKDWAAGLNSPPAMVEGKYTLKVTPGTGTAVEYSFVIKKTGSTGGGGTVTPPPTPNGCGTVITLASFTSFPVFTGITGFSPAYADAGNQCLAINAASYKGVFAAAQAIFSQATDNYDITITTLTETDGESTYRLKVGGVLVGEFQNPATTVDYVQATKTWKNVAVKTGDLIQVEFNSHTNGKIPEGNTTAFSRGRWKQVSFDPVCKAQTGDYIESGGIVIMEPEKLAVSSEWKKVPSTDLSDASMAGALGNGWIEWAGSNSSAITQEDAAAKGVLVIRFKITKEGDYTFRWRTKQHNSGQASDQGNDTFVKLASGQILPMTGSKGNSYTMTKFTKVWIQSKTVWSWGTNFEPVYAEFVYFPKIHYTPGIHEIRLAGRSSGHAIDRLVLYHSDIQWNEATFNSLPESQRADDNVGVKLTTDNSSARLSVYPNPCNGKFTVQSTKNLLHIKIFQTDGRCIYSQSANGLTTEVQTPDLNNGLYLLRAQSVDGQMLSERFVVD